MRRPAHPVRGVGIFASAIVTAAHPTVDVHAPIP
jgi:hypothetical protein